MMIGPGTRNEMPPHSQVISGRLRQGFGYNYSMMLYVHPQIFKENLKDQTPGEPRYFTVVIACDGTMTLEFNPPPNKPYDVRIQYAPPWREI